MTDATEDIDAVETDLVDFVPDPSQLGRVPRERVGMPRWLIAALAAAAVLIVILTLRPGPAAAHASYGSESAPVSAHHDLFQLPEWHDDQPDPTGK